MSVRAPGVREVRATQDEIGAWRRKYPRRSPPYRVECLSCGTRMWLSGIGLGSHRRKCTPARTVPGTSTNDQED